MIPSGKNAKEELNTLLANFYQSMTLPSSSFVCYRQLKQELFEAGLRVAKTYQELHLKLKRKFRFPASFEFQSYYREVRTDGPTLIFNFRERKTGQIYEIVWVNGQFQIDSYADLFQNKLYCLLEDLQDDFKSCFSDGMVCFLLQKHPMAEVVSTFGNVIISYEKDADFMSPSLWPHYSFLTMISDYQNSDYILRGIKEHHSINNIYRVFRDPIDENNKWIATTTLRQFLQNWSNYDGSCSELYEGKERLRRALAENEFDDVFGFYLDSLPKSMQSYFQEKPLPFFAKQKTAFCDTKLMTLIQERLRDNKEHSARIWWPNLQSNIFYYEECPEPHYVMHDFFRNNRVLRLLDLSVLCFDHVCVAGIDFSGTNAAIHPQKVYRRDFTNTNLENVVLLSQDFTDCILDGSVLTFPNYVEMENVASCRNAHIDYYFYQGALNPEFVMSLQLIKETDKRNLIS